MCKTAQPPSCPIRPRLMAWGRQWPRNRSPPHCSDCNHRRGSREEVPGAGEACGGLSPGGFPLLVLPAHSDFSDFLPPPVPSDTFLPVLSQSLMGMVQVIPQSLEGPRFTRSYTLRFRFLQLRAAVASGDLAGVGLGSSRCFIGVSARSHGCDCSLTCTWLQAAWLCMRGK